jgi:hypothetical protein
LVSVAAEHTAYLVVYERCSRQEKVSVQVTTILVPSRILCTEVVVPQDAYFESKEMTVYPDQLATSLPCSSFKKKAPQCGSVDESTIAKRDPRGS